MKNQGEGSGKADVNRREWRSTLVSLNYARQTQCVTVHALRPVNQ